VTAAIIGVAAIPLLVVALFVAFLIALCGGGNCN
jgi:hypothetical protein